VEVDVDQFAKGQHLPAIDQQAWDLPRDQMQADAQAFERPGLATLRQQQTDEKISGTTTVDGQRSNEPLRRAARCTMSVSRRSYHN
jgi:hypothetical protein